MHLSAIVALAYTLSLGVLVFADDDYSWVRNWAAVGDSFTAGIGSGNLYSELDNDLDCSRYDYTYPTIINRYFEPSVRRFTYTACSGATTPDIYKQITALPTGLDLVVMSAGGNDLCLVRDLDYLREKRVC
jgi:lysophospholipase L1-like esterase